MTVVSPLPLVEMLSASFSVGMILTWLFELTKLLKTDTSSLLAESW